MHLLVCFELLFCCRIHISINYASSRSWGSKAAPDHHTTTTMFECCWQFFLWNAELVLHQIKQDINLVQHSTFVSSVQRFFSQKSSWRDHQDVFWQTRWGFVSFWSAVGFAIELSPACHFCPFSFFVVVAEWWSLILIETYEACSFPKALEMALSPFPE